MMLMRENMKHSMLQSVSTTSATLDLTANSRIRSRSSLEGGGFVCGDCGRTYKLKSSLRNHQKWECGKEPQFKCPYCSYKAKQKMHMARHMERMHREIDVSSIKTEIKSEIVEKDSADKDSVCSSEKSEIHGAIVDKEEQGVEGKQYPEPLVQDLSLSHS